MSWQVCFLQLPHCDTQPDVSLSAVVCRWCPRRSAWWTSPATVWKQCLNISSTARTSPTSTYGTTSWASRVPGVFSTFHGNNVHTGLLSTVLYSVDGQEKFVYMWNLWNHTGDWLSSFLTVSYGDGFLISASLSGVIISYPSGLRCTPSALLAG